MTSMINEYPCKYVLKDLKIIYVQRNNSLDKAKIYIHDLLSLEKSRINNRKLSRIFLKKKDYNLKRT